ncbi:MAG: 7,8-didemethyl-8-hydroxy-5-deazariboflavin synthase subunit CofG [Cyanobacteria bacterium J083]|nr:MAG: 7,8-didemethyl-8-hydroxy-5-deazariboflavin synthase subunit CofG [Cyanobacteria bacterium J083]
MSAVVTYSPAYTIVPTYECFNRCTYCNFRTDPGKSDWISLVEVEKILTKFTKLKIWEVLVLSGEVHPNSSRRENWFNLIYKICELALSLGFLPHTNAGILTFEEMAKLKQVNVSMGLMLEQITPDLGKTVHKYAPSKEPQLRLQQLKWAGELGIPFTTGLLLGIGESEQERWNSLEAIASIHQQWGHIQEVILQPYSRGTHQSLVAESFNPYDLPDLIALARKILPPEITIQIPPNLIPEEKFLLECLEAGARDLGGISPKDEVNPDYNHPQVTYLANLLKTANWQLKPRLPIYPRYYSWLSEKLRKLVNLPKFAEKLALDGN